MKEKNYLRHRKCSKNGKITITMTNENLKVFKQKESDDHKKIFAYEKCY